MNVTEDMRSRGDHTPSVKRNVLCTRKALHSHALIGNTKGVNRMTRSLVFALVFVSGAGASEPRLFVENAVLSDVVSTFDLKVFANTPIELSPIFIIGVGWDPAMLDIVAVNFEGTIFQDYGLPFWREDRMLTIKPDGRPVLGVYTMLSCDPCVPAIPAGDKVPLVNLRFRKLEGGTGTTAVRLTRAPGPPTHPEEEYDTQLYV